MVTGNVAKIETMGMLDGPGVRTIVFMQGCVLRCAYCHNPTLLSLQGGEQYTPLQLLQKVMRYSAYYKHGGGVTVSGGEPLVQQQFVTEFFKLCKQHNIHTCLDTSAVGLPGDNYEELLAVTDLVLLDIKHTNREEFKKLTLVEKERTENFRAALDASNARVWIRQVVLPNFNDNEAYMQELLQEILPIKNIDKIEFLPYHTMAEHVYEENKMQYRLKGVPAMDASVAKELETKFVQMYQTAKK